MPETKPIGQLKPFTPKPVGDLKPFNPANKDINQAYYDALNGGGLNNLQTSPDDGFQKASQIIDNIPGLSGDTDSSGKRDILKDLARKRADTSVMSDAILTLQGKHPNQKGGSKYYLDEIGVPHPIANNERPPAGYDVASHWGTQKQAEDDNFFTSLTKHAWNGIVGGAEGFVDLADTGQGLVTGKQSTGAQNLKNAAQALKFETKSAEGSPIFDSKEMKSWTEAFDPQRYNFNSENVKGNILQGMESVISFALGAKGFGTAAKGLKGLKGATDLSKVQNLAVNAAGAYNLSLSEMLDVGREAGLDGRDLYGFSSVAAIPQAALEVAFGPEAQLVKNGTAAAAKTEFKEVVKNLATGIEKDQAGNITKQGLDKLSKEVTFAASDISKKYGLKELAKNVTGEALTEGAQEWTQEVSKQLYNKLASDPKFKDADAFKPETLGKMINATIAGALGSIGPSAVLSKQGNDIDRENGRSNNAFEIVKKGEESVKSFKKNVVNAVRDGDLTQEQADNALLRINSFDNYNKITSTWNIDDQKKRELFDKTFEKENIEQQLSTMLRGEKDPSKLQAILQGEYNSTKKIADDLQKDINEIVLRSKVEKQTTVGEKTIKDILKKEETKTEKPTEKPKSALAERLVQLRNKNKKEDNRTFEEIPDYEYNDSKFNNRLKHRKTAEYLDRLPNKTTVGKIASRSFNDDKGKLNSVLGIELEGGKKIRFASSMLRPEGYRGHFREERFKEFPVGMPIGIKVEEIPGAKEGDSPKKVIKAYNAETGKFVGWMKESTKGKSDYTPSQVDVLEHLQTIDESPTGPAKTTQAPTSPVTPNIRQTDAPKLEELTRTLEETGPEGLSIENGKTSGGTKELPRERTPIQGYKYITSRDRDGKINGVIEVSYFSDENGYLKDAPQNIKVVVSPNNRRKGVATKLFEFAQKNGIDLSGIRGKNVTPDGAALYNSKITPLDESNSNVNSQVDPKASSPINGNESAVTENFYSDLDKLKDFPAKVVLNKIKHVIKDKNTVSFIDAMIKNSDRIDEFSRFRGFQEMKSRIGVYWGTSGDIFLSNKMGDFRSDNHLAKVLVHEYIHAFTVNAIENPSNENEKKFEGIMSGVYYFIKRDTNYPDEYGFKNLKEFVSELGSNPDFVNKIKNEHRTIWDKIIEAILSLFSIDYDTETSKLVKKGIDSILSFVPHASPRPSEKKYESRKSVRPKKINKKDFAYFRAKFLKRDTEQEQDDLLMIAEALKGDLSQAERDDLIDVRDEILQDIKNDKPAYLEYLADKKQAEKIATEEDLEGYKFDDLIEEYNKAESTEVKDAKLRLAVYLNNESTKRLREVVPDIDKKTNSKDFTWIEKWMKVLSNVSEKFPAIQGLSKEFEKRYLAKVQEANELKSQHEKLGKAVIRERNNGLGVLSDAFNSDSAKYFSYLDDNGKLRTSNEGLSKAQIEYLDFIRDLVKDRNTILDEDDNIVDNTLIKTDKGFLETLKSDGYKDAIGLLWPKSEDYNINYKGGLTSKFDRPYIGKSYSKDFYKAANNFIDDQAHVKYMKDLVPVVDGIEMFYRNLGIEEGKNFDNLIKFLEEWKKSKIYQQQTKTTPAIDIPLRTLRGLTSLSVMGFNIPANIMNVIVGTVNNITKDGPANFLKGNKRLASGKKGLAILKHYDVINADDSSNPKFSALGTLGKIGFAGLKYGEWEIQGSNFLGKLTPKEWNSFEVADGKLQIKPEDKEALDEKMIQYKNEVSDVHGKYSEKDRGNVLNGEIGKALLQFKVWAPAFWKDKFGDEFIDSNNKVRRGTFRGYLPVKNGEKLEAGKALEELKKNWKDKGWVKGTWNHDQTRSNLTYLAAIGILTWLTHADDEDENNRKKVLSYETALSNFLFVFDPQQAKYMIERPAAAIGPITKLIDATQALMDGNTEKAGKTAKKILPYNKMTEITNLPEQFGK